MTVFEDLKWRGLIKDISSPELEEKLNKGGMSFYIGTDPTADSLHVGHLSSFLISKRLKDAGHHPYLLVGGGTGLIGDPRPTKERAMISKEAVNKNFEGIKNQVQRLFGFDVVNNYDWIKDINTLDFLRDYGKFFNVNYMLDKDIVRRRLDAGITYTEFSYMILQALDFKYLHEHNNVDLQCAGSDQWGNITAGIDLIRKSTGDEVYGFTMPLVTDSQGKKFGKSEGNALWLDKNKTSSYKLYQFFVNVEDSMVIDYLKIYTFLSKEEIEEYAKKNIEKYEIVTARAVAHLSILLEYGLPMLKNNYYFIAMKGNLEVEIKESSKALEILNSKIEKIEEFKLPLENSNRTLIKIKKIKSCPKKYPRKPGLPSKEPII